MESNGGSSTLGYITCGEHDMVVMAAAMGKRHQVINIGLDAKRMVVEGVPVLQWAQSLGHKVGSDLFSQSYLLY